MSKAFSDHFASVAQQYADFRPHYPEELFAWLASQCTAHERAWDCGAGNGQASVPLADYFAVVEATDASAAQLAQAVPHSKIRYRVAPAEDSGLATASVDLVTVAQALHWFDLDKFYAEVRRVLKPGGVIAAWSYGMIGLDSDALDAALRDFYWHTIGPYWPSERRHVETGYRELDFPFQPVGTPALAMQVEWTMAQLLGYLRSWSASARYQTATGNDPTTDLIVRMSASWGAPECRHRVSWPLSIRAGRMV